MFKPLDYVKPAEIPSYYNKKIFYNKIVKPLFKETFINDLLCVVGVPSFNQAEDETIWFENDIQAAADEEEWDWKL